MFVRLNSKWGKVIAKFDENHVLAGLWFEGQKYFPKIDEEIIEYETVIGSETIIGSQPSAIKALKNQLERYESGNLKTFTVPLAPKGTPFQERVWQLLLEIPFGETTSYGEIARKMAVKMGKESMSAQAVGGAVGHNPLSIIVPCHRVVGSNGSLTGYAGGIDIKKSLLIHEGAELITDKK